MQKAESGKAGKRKAKTEIKDENEGKRNVAKGRWTLGLGLI
jgi:hypothetical protein